jgi:hypothetical protein
MVLDDGLVSPKYVAKKEGNLKIKLHLQSTPMSKQAISIVSKAF